MAGATKHFETLDALRGVAAIIVVLGHLGLYGTVNLFPKFYLAVDFFFMLSGVVIARAYEAELVAGGAEVFIKKRIIRLYPLIVLSMGLGLVTEASKTLIAHSSSAIPLGQLPWEFACGVLLLPYLSGVGWASMFPLNLPSWSLFFEFLANALYAFAAPWLTTRRLVAVIAVAGCCLMAGDIYGGSVNFGWTRNYALLGFARVMFSFPFGVLLYRLYARGWFDELPRISGFWLALALVILLALPKHMGVMFDPVCLIVIFPAIVVSGCFDKIPAWSVPVAALLGRLSYPVYVLHWPTVYRNGYHLIAKTHGVTLGLACFFDVAAICLIAWLALKFFDEPVRRYLTRRFIATPKGMDGLSDHLVMPGAGGHAVAEAIQLP